MPPLEKHLLNIVQRQNYYSIVSTRYAQHCFFCLPLFRKAYSQFCYNREESEYTKVTLDDGSAWGVYVSNEKDGKPYVVYASRVLSEKDKRGNDRLTYFNYQVSSSRSNMYWADVNAFIGDLKALEQNLKLEGLPAAE